MGMQSIKSRIIIIGDSLSMPRLEENISYENTYAYKLSQKKDEYDVICRSVRANDTRKQTSRQSIYDDLSVFNPDVVIVHLGIVDCAPRLFGKKEMFLLSLLPKKIQNIIISPLSRKRFLITKQRPKVYVKINEFKHNLSILVGEIKKHTNEIIFISIAATNRSNIERSYGIVKNIGDYNEVIKEECSRSDCIYLDFFDSTLSKKFIIDDGIHINEMGHDYLTERLSEILNKS